MKTLLSFLGIILMLASCGSNESETALSTVNVNGREVSTVKIGNLGVMTEDLGQMNWDDAMKACSGVNSAFNTDGWRLPTKDELNVLYENKDKIGGSADYDYWSSTEGGNATWVQNFGDGFQGLFPKP